MARSLFLAILLAVAIALFTLSSWGRAEVNNPERFAQQSGQALSSTEVRSLITAKIVDEVWSGTDAQGAIQKEVKDLLPKEAGILAGPAALASKAAFTSAVDNLLKQPFARDIWERSVLVAYKNTLRALQSKQSALLIQKERISIDLSIVIRQAAKEIGLPQSIKSAVPPGLGEITLAETKTVSKVQTAYNLLNLAPLITLPFIALFLGLIIIINKRALWQGALWTSGALLLASLIVFLAKEAVPPLLFNGAQNTLSASIASALWSQWAESISSISTDLILIALAAALVALVISPLLKSTREKAKADAKEQIEKASREIKKRWNS